MIQQITRLLLIKNKAIIGVILFCFTLVSCEKDQHVVFDQYIQTQGQWNKNDIMTYVYKAQDTLSKHDMYMNVRANQSYPYSNMFVIFKLYQPDSSIIVDTLQYQMADSEGLLIGSGFSDIKESKLFLKENYIFPSSGTYKFTLEHAVRALGEVDKKDQLPGISEVGFRIEKKQ